MCAFFEATSNARTTDATQHSGAISRSLVDRVISKSYRLVVKARADPLFTTTYILSRWVPFFFRRYFPRNSHAENTHAAVGCVTHFYFCFVLFECFIWFKGPPACFCVTRMTPGHEQIYIQRFRMQLWYTHSGIIFLTIFLLFSV